MEMDEGLARTFKMEVVRRKGKLKGALGEAMEEAIRLWLNHERR